MNIDIVKYSYVSLVICLSISMVHPSDSGQRFWKVKPLSKVDKTYHAVIKKPYEMDPLHTFCSGVVLNDRYVLTIFRCTRTGHGFWAAADIKIYVNFTYFNENLTDKVVSDGIEHDVEKIWPDDFDEYLRPDASYSLLRTKSKIKFDSKFSCINLPKGRYWQYMSPEKVTITTSSFRIGDKGPKRSLEILEGFRDCTVDLITDVPFFFIPTCLLYPFEIWDPMQWIQGYPLVHNNTLLGLRNYLASRYGPPPHFDKIDGTNLFLNVALFAKLLKSQMKDYTPCSKIAPQ